MQSNNYLREFSADVAGNNFIADGDLKTSTLISNGATLNSVAKSNLYNTLSRLTTKACASLIDLVAQENPTVQFYQATPIETWITAVQNAVATKKSVDNIIDGTTMTAHSTLADNATQASNSQNVQNIDLSSESRAVFGDLSVARYKTLFSGNTTIDTNLENVITLTEEISIGDVLEIKFKPVANKTSRKSITLVTSQGGIYNFGSADLFSKTVRYVVFQIGSSHYQVLASTLLAVSESALIGVKVDTTTQLKFTPTIYYASSSSTYEEPFIVESIKKVII